ncbi:recombinase family protein [Amylibacter sp.]|nr:recombinase family protein [Amylibacter sp.]
MNEEHQVIATYAEIDSDSKEKRIDISKAIECCKKHYATLIVSKVDRLSRNLHQITGFMENKKLELRVASLPNADKPMLQFFGIMAEMECDFISKRTKEALASAKARGVKLGGARTNQKLGMMQ